ncbi:MAG: HNH endonuclease [Maribacter sp.]
MNINKTELQCPQCLVIGVNYSIDDTGIHSKATSNCCGRFIKNVSKVDKYGTKEQQSLIWKKTNGRCCYCGTQLNPFEKVGYTYEHMESQNNGGSHDLNNLYACCKSCNSSKGKKSITEYRKYVKKRDNVEHWLFYFESMKWTALGKIMKVIFEGNNKKSGE